MSNVRSISPRRIPGRGALLPEAVKKLRSSGLERGDAELLGMYSVANAKEELDPSFEEEPALVIPYIGPDGKPMRAHKGWPDFYRIRYLGEPKVDFKKLSGVERPKYAQPPRTGTVAYFPQGYVNWAEIIGDAYADILITEGELKAAKACAEGFPTIGLGGVWNFRSGRNATSFLPELEQIDWVFRNVHIVFDSDARSKPQIMEAVLALTQELNDRGAVVRLVTLPDVYTDGNKTGLDDFLLNRTDVEFADLLTQGLHMNAMDTLMDMNLRFVYVEDTGVVIDMQQRRKFPLKLFTTTSTWAVKKICVTRFKKNGDSSIEQINSAQAWVDWPLRNTCDGVTYAPGEGDFVEQEGRILYNEWTGWGCQPIEGDVTPFLELVDFLFTKTDEDHKNWFLDWLAHTVQFPAVKMFTAVLVHGIVQGTGKSLIFYTMGQIFGKNFFEIGNDELKDTWWLAGKQFILGDEITGTDRRADADRLKSMITRETAIVNVKFMPQYELPDLINYAFTSNHSAALLIEDTDRRYFIHEVKVTAPLPTSFYRNYDKWRKHENGASHLFHWLLQRDISNFEPSAPAPRTEAKVQMARLAKSDMELWVYELFQEPESKMYIGRDKRTMHQRELFTAKELMDMFIQELQPDYKPSQNAFSRALKSAGHLLAYNGNPIQDRDQKISDRYWAVKNHGKWAEATRQKCIDNILLEPINANAVAQAKGSRGAAGSGKAAKQDRDNGRVQGTGEGAAPGRRRKL